MVSKLIAAPEWSSGRDIENWVAALILAATKGHKDVVQELLGSGAALDVRGACEGTALTWAAMNGHASVVGELARAGVALDVQDMYQSTALMYASSQGRLPALQYLLSSGANPNLADRNGNTALHMVTDTADESIAVAMTQALLARGGLKSIRNFQDYTPFDTASIQQRDSDYRPGYRPMDIALFSGSDAVATLLAVT